LQKELLWRPKLNTEKAVKWTIDWFRKPVDQQADFTFQQINEYFAL
jgi:dTDP-D-glucose 4,6-dehydratase